MTPGSGTVVDPRMTLALWLRDGRARKKLSLDDVARITKIQARILEKLESGQLDGLPAEVFVKGFVRSFARCVGLDEAEALDRYTACKSAPVARALVDSMSELAPRVARTTRPIEVPVVVEAPEIIEVVPPVSEVSALAPVVETSATDLPVIDISVSDLPAITSSAEIPVAPAQNPKKKRTRKKAAAPVDGVEVAPKRTRSRKKKVALGTPAEPTPVVAAPVEAVVEAAPVASVVEAAPAAEPAIEVALAIDSVIDAEPAVEAAPAIDSVIDAEPAIEAAAAIDAVADAAPVVEDALTSASEAMEIIVADVAAEDAVDTTISAEGSGPTHGTWKPTMPPLSVTTSVPWRRPTMPASTLAVTPSLVIDDADPDRAEREQEERATLREPHKVSFLPPILLDREDKSARQGGLTLAVIILLIAATLTLSYLMRRPSVSGDGVTMNETPASLA
jgi:hypothetical protein